jgi:hypothetical protein
MELFAKVKHLRTRVSNARVNATRDARRVSTLDDGDYDCVVVDVSRDEDDVVVIELAIASGQHKGDTVALRSAMQHEPLDWLGVPGTLHVVNGVPRFRLENT